MAKQTKIDTARSYAEGQAAGERLGRRLAPLIIIGFVFAAIAWRAGLFS